MYSTVVALTVSAIAQFPPEFVPIESVDEIVVPVPYLCPPAPAPMIAARPVTGRRPDVVLLWNEMLLGAMKAERTSPPMAARHLAMVHTAMYDAVNSVVQSHEPYLVSLAARPGTSPEAAAAAAAYRTLAALYPRQAARFDLALDASLAAVPDGPAKSDGLALGRAVADRVLASRGGDESATGAGYAPATGLGSWRPTPPGYRPPLLPRWASLRCFAMSSASQFRPAAGPPALASEAFAASFREVKALGAARSTVRTPEQTEIAHFWADGEGTVTPPGHWNRIAQSVSEARQLPLADNARLFALLNVALADAAIACWDCKFHFNYWRPVTAIREADRLGNPTLAADPNWTPLLPTPPFPSYTSGHSTFSSAAAAALASFFGTDEVRFASASEGLPGVTRSFDRFSAAAREAGLSRIYGGIHWDFDNRDGLAGGTELGRYVAQALFRPKAVVNERRAPATFAIWGRPVRP